MALRVYNISELLALEPPEWLVENILPAGAFGEIHGQPGAGKSFVALDLALSIAAGVPWQGHPTRKACVVYISAEGGGGISKRVGAWLDAQGVSPLDYDSVLASFVVSAIAIHPQHDGLDQLLEATVYSREHQEEVAASLEPGEELPLVVVVDTLARCLEGDENQQEDMGHFVKALDILREDHNATTLVVHHTSKGGNTERGSTALRGACDTMLEVTKEKSVVTVACSKQKDHEPFADLELNLIAVPKWDSCVLVQREKLKASELQRRNELFALYHAENPDTTIREAAEDLGVSNDRVFQWRKANPGVWTQK